MLEGPFAFQGLVGPKEVRRSEVIQYQVIMEPISGALLSFVPKMQSTEFRKLSLNRGCKQFRAAWPFREEFSLVSMWNKSGATKIRISRRAAS